MIDWFPFAVKNPAPEHLWGRYDKDGPFRGVLHTTETDTFSPHAGDYGGWHSNYPHFTVVLSKDGKTVTVYQHIPLTHAARALKNLAGGVETNSEHAVQIEIVWRAGNSQNMPRVLLDTLRSLMRWLEHECGIARTYYKNESHFYPPENSYRLGSEPWRMSATEWNNFNGWCGHQNIPEQVHGDPGKIDVAYLMAQTPEADNMPKPTDITAVVDDPTSNGYWMVEAQGGVFTKDGAIFCGSLLQLPADKRKMDPDEFIVGLVPKLNADKSSVVGYTLVTNKKDGYYFAK